MHRATDAVVPFQPGLVRPLGGGSPPSQLATMHAIRTSAEPLYREALEFKLTFYV